MVSYVAEPEQNSGAPSFAFRRQGLSSVEEDPENIESIQSYPVE